MHSSVITVFQLLELLARNNSATADRVCTTQPVPLTFQRLCCTVCGQFTEGALCNNFAWRSKWWIVTPCSLVDAQATTPKDRVRSPTVRAQYYRRLQLLDVGRQVVLLSIISKQREASSIYTVHLKPSGHYIYRQFNIQQFYVPPTQCIYVFCVDLRTNSYYFPILH